MSFFLVCTPAGDSRFTSAAVASPTAGQVIASLKDLPAGNYSVTVGTSVSATGTLFANMQLLKNGNTVIGGGILSSYDGEAQIFMKLEADSTQLDIVAIAADSGVTYHVDNFTATPLKYGSATVPEFKNAFT